MSLGSIHPNDDQLASFLREAEDGPIVMINLLRYRDDAQYEAGAKEAPCTGQEAYGRYSDGVMPLLAKAGGRPIWIGLARATLIAPAGESWDHAVLVEYPTRQAFIEMTTSEVYEAIAHHRTAALEDSRLIATTGTLIPQPAVE